MSNGFAPGWIAVLNGTGFQTTSAFAKPSLSATAYAVALSRPLPFVGSPFSHGFVFAPPSFGSKYGGKAGVSAPIVSLPAVIVLRLAAVQAFSVADGATEADAGALATADGLAAEGLATADADGLGTLPVHAATRTATTTSGALMTDGTLRNGRIWAPPADGTRTGRGVSVAKGSARAV